MVEFPLYFRRKPLGNKNFYKNQTDILTNPTTQCKIIESNFVECSNRRVTYFTKFRSLKRYDILTRQGRWKKWEKSCPMSKKKNIQNCCQKTWRCSEQKQESPKKNFLIFLEYQGKRIVQWKVKGSQSRGIPIFP